MTDYILDASIVVQHFIQDAQTEHVDALFDMVGDTVTAHIPQFCLLECANVLWKHVRFHGVSKEDALQLTRDMDNLSLNITPVQDLLPRALEIGLTHQLAVYDSVYIAMAEHLKFSLITVDAKQAKAATATGITLKPVTDFATE
ncbi:MAG: type II toxin-antitoxin system VapC family toxin [Chloroflexota bacterium]